MATTTQALGLEKSVVVLSGRIEELTLPEPVDVIVSEWMGCFMLYESMLDSVLYALDRWLKQGGTMLPQRARMWLAPYRDDEEAEERIAFWSNVHGIDMSCLAPIAQAEQARKPAIEFAMPQNMMSDASCVLDLDLEACAVADCQVVRAGFECRSHVRAEVHAFVGYFDVELSAGQWLSTSPEEEPTHWRQTLFFLRQPLLVQQDELLKGTLAMSQNVTNPRCWDVELEFAGEDAAQPTQTQRYELDVSC